MKSRITILSLFFLFFCAGFSLFGQETSTDSLLPLNHHNSLAPLTEKTVCFRAGIGVQKSFYTEAGLAFHKCTYSDVGFFSQNIYASMEWVPNPQQKLYGVKVGYEANSSLFLLNVGLELKYQTDQMVKDWVITPKVGLGLLGEINLFYGYNISTNRSPFADAIGPHQFSLVFNFNRNFLGYFFD